MPKIIKVKGSEYFQKGKDYTCKLVTAGKGAKVLYCHTGKDTLSGFNPRIDVGQSFYHIRIRPPEKFTKIRTPDWAARVANSVAPGAMVKTGKTDSIWQIQNVMIPINYSQRQAKKLAKQIVSKIERKPLSAQFGRLLEKAIAKVTIEGKPYICDLRTMYTRGSGKRLYCHREKTIIDYPRMKTIIEGKAVEKNDWNIGLAEYHKAINRLHQLQKSRSLKPRDRTTVRQLKSIIDAFQKTDTGHEIARIHNTEGYEKAKEIFQVEETPEWKMTAEEAGLKVAKEDLQRWESKITPEIIEREKKNWGESLAEKTIEDLKALIRTKKARMKGHKNVVRHALEEGKPVPDRVLKDYPDLKKLANEISEETSKNITKTVVPNFNRGKRLLTTNPANIKDATLINNYADLLTIRTAVQRNLLPQDWYAASKHGRMPKDPWLTHNLTKEVLQYYKAELEKRNLLDKFTVWVEIGKKFKGF